MHFYCGLKTEGLGELKLEMHELLSSEGKGHHLLHADVFSASKCTELREAAILD